ncbi:cytochrome P450 [Rhizobium bangladeshense]|uniref:Cytochrome P450 n=1 Tax=Rhizobium bangladeshense TaxID=1138189 RepID=A0ABS7LIM8_9HYPH|nr:MULTISPECIES: cytochrome P450 [Rhizobium]MBX4867274.1 cytochrome P450 [Rhizobium bangladeshense]MBX4871565.1 cytochrome P450 [Rhizobium bangladeshense]MBX4882879.1 cytochrome P450 [Rhizobium bangladeshense]MBX4891269.1 cytochrome P450 [Rhizobium bangladeshense]MBX4920578.1 cytochrome P450 [Rhizobium bangladeshense]
MIARSHAIFPRVNRAGWIDTLRVITTVMAPTVAKGIIIRRPTMERLAQRQGFDTKAVQQMQRLKNKYGPAPLLLPIPFRPQLLILNPGDVATVLQSSPEPFAAATAEKHAALAHFEPKNVLISSAPQRAQLRPAHEHALATADRLHPYATQFKNIVEDEFSQVLTGIGSGRPYELDWPAFSQTWFRVVRRVVLGERARNDVTLTETLNELRGRANWAFALPVDQRKLARFHEQVGRYLGEPEKHSLVNRFPKGDQLAPENQVAQWLFAFDAAGIAVLRTLAVLACHVGYWSKAVEEAMGRELDRPFTRSCLLEVLRLWPTTPVILRQLAKDIKSGNRVIARGTGVIIFAPFFHRDPALLYANRMEPSIWGQNDALPSAGLVPFSAGPVICPAHNLVPMIASFAVGTFLSAADIVLLQPPLTVGDLPGTLNHFDIRLKLTARRRQK